MARKATVILGAYTIVELIASLAILCILAALLAPVITKVKSNGFRAETVSNLRQICQATLVYSSGYDDRIPYAVDECDRRGKCRALYSPVLWSVIKRDHVPAFAEALKPYGVVESMFLIKAGAGPQTYADMGSSLYYPLVLSTASLSLAQDRHCPYFTERDTYFWDGGGHAATPENKILNVDFTGRVGYDVVSDVQALADSCRSADFVTYY